MEKNRREFSRNTVLARPNNGLQPIQRDQVSIKQSPNRSSRGIRFNTPARKLVLPPRRKVQASQEQQYPEGYGQEVYDPGYIEQEYIPDEEYDYQQQ